MAQYGRALCWGIPLFVGVTLALSWVFSGGFFAPGHDAYGEVPIPGELVVNLPVGPARLYVQERGYFGSKGDQASIPAGIAASVEPAAGGAALVLECNTHAAVTTVDRESWVTFARFDVPISGAYRVTVVDPGDNGDASHTVTVGKGPWAPVPPWLFGLGIVAVAFVVGLVADRIRARAISRR